MLVLFCGFLRRRFFCLANLVVLAREKNPGCITSMCSSNQSFAGPSLRLTETAREALINAVNYNVGNFNSNSTILAPTRLH